MKPPQTTNSSTVRMEQNSHVANISSRWTEGRVRLVEGTPQIDQADRYRARRVLRFLQQQGSSIADVGHDSTQPVQPNEIPFIIQSHMSSTTCIEMTEQSTVTATTVGSNGNSRNPRMLDHSLNSRLFPRQDTCQKLATQAREVLIAATHESNNSPWELHTPDCDFHSIFRKSYLARSAENGPATKTSIRARDERTLHPVRTVVIQKIVPRTVVFDGFLRKVSSNTTFKDQASHILKNVVKKNASILLPNSLSTTASDDVGSLLRRASATALTNRSPGSTLHGLQQRTLPPQVLEYDRLRVEESQNVIASLANRVIDSLQPPPISLTNLSISIPSVWSHEVVSTVVKNVQADMLIFRPGDCDACDEKTREVSVKFALSDDSTKIAEIPRPAHRDDESEESKTEHHIQNNLEHSVMKPTSLTQPTNQIVTFAINENVSTDELVTSFLDQVISKKSSSELVPDKLDQTFQSNIDNLARPAIWFLSRMKMLKMRADSMSCALQSIPLRVLETVTLQAHSKLKTVSANASKTSTDDIINMCTAFRSSAWLHVLRMVIECRSDSKGSEVFVLSKLLVSSTYRATLGNKNVLTLSALYASLGGVMNKSEWLDEPKGIGDADEELIPLRPAKKPRINAMKPESNPVRVLGSIRLLEQDELLESLTDQSITIIERELPSALDIVVDEHNAIVLLHIHTLTGEQFMKLFTYELAESQTQFNKFWVVMGGEEESEPFRHCFYAALANFSVAVQTFVCDSDEEVAEVIRGIIDECAESALSKRQQLPKMWFGRPFMLEEESQLERLLSSTQVINPFAAQSVLHRLSIDELLTLSLEEITHILKGSLTGTQASLLWRFLHCNHGIESG